MKIKAVIDNPREKTMSVVLCRKDENGVEMSATEIVSRFVNGKNTEKLKIVSQDITENENETTVLLLYARNKYHSDKEIEVVTDFDKLDKEKNEEIFKRLSSLVVKNFVYSDNKPNNKETENE